LPEPTVVLPQTNGIPWSAKGLHGRPCENALGHGGTTEGPREEASQEREERDVDPDEFPAAFVPLEVQVGGPDDAHAIDVEQLVIEEVAADEPFAGPAHVVMQVERGREKPDGARGRFADGGGVDERTSGADANHDAGEPGVLAGVPANDEVEQAADGLTR
jgi:hypothetical protein